MSEVYQGDEMAQLELPPGFRFHPSDEEIVTHYLTPKALNRLFACLVIADVDLNKIEPWDLPRMAKMGEKEWYFFCHKDRKYPTGTRTNRATASGYWKATGKDKEIFRGRGVLVGMKKTLVFYLGRAPRGEKTPWIMHEYRLEGKLPPSLPRAAKDEWAVCRVFNKDLAAKQPGQTAAAATPPASDIEWTDPLTFIEDFLDTQLPPLIDSPPFVKGEAASSSSGAVPGISGYQQAVKTEAQPAAARNPTTVPPPLLQDPYISSGYFSLPATNPQAAPGASPAIRRQASRPLFPEIEDLCPDYGFLDCSDIWKV